MITTGDFICVVGSLQMVRKSDMLPPTSSDVCDLFGISGIPMIVIVHPDGESSANHRNAWFILCLR